MSVAVFIVLFHLIAVGFAETNAAACPALLQAPHREVPPGPWQRASRNASSIHKGASIAGFPLSFADAQRHSERLRVMTAYVTPKTSGSGSSSWTSLSQACEGEDNDENCLDIIGGSLSVFQSLLTGTISGEHDTKATISAALDLGSAVLGMWCPVCGMAAGALGGTLLGIFGPKEESVDEKIAKALKDFEKKILDEVQRRLDKQFLREKLADMEADIRALQESLDFVPELLKRFDAATPEDNRLTLFVFNLNMLHETTAVWNKVKAITKGTGEKDEKGKECFFVMPLGASVFIARASLYLQIAHHVAADTDAKNHVLRTLLEQTEEARTWAEDCEEKAGKYIDERVDGEEWNTGAFHLWYKATGGGPCGYDCCQDVCKAEYKPQDWPFDDKVRISDVVNCNPHFENTVVVECFLNADDVCRHHAFHTKLPADVCDRHHAEKFKNDTKKYIGERVKTINDLLNGQQLHLDRTPEYAVEHGWRQSVESPFKYYLSKGLCSLEGRMLPGDGWTMMALPAACRPTKRLVFNVATSAGTTRLDVETTGVITLGVARYSGVDMSTWQWISLSGVIFSTSAAELNNILRPEGLIFSTSAAELNNLVLAEEWNNYPGYGSATYAVRDGFCILEGLLRNVNDWSDGGTLAQLPSECTPQEQLVFLANHHEFALRIDVSRNGMIQVAGQKTHDWVSLSGIAFPTSALGPHLQPESWHNLGQPFAVMTATKVLGGICIIQGTITKSSADGSVIASLPPDCQPLENNVYAVHNHGGTATRVDVTIGNIFTRSELQGTLSLNGIRFVHRGERGRPSTPAMGCDKDGFELAMRFSSSSQMIFSSPLWENTVLLDEVDPNPAKDVDGKFAAFNIVSAWRIKGCVTHDLPTPQTLFNLFNTDISSTTNIKFGAATANLWADAAGASGLSDGWKATGINYYDDVSGYHARVRFGALFNNDKHVHAANDAVGFGADNAIGKSVGSGWTRYPSSGKSTSGTIWVFGSGGRCS